MAFQLLRRRPTLKKILDVLRREMPRLREACNIRSLSLFGPYTSGEGTAST